MSRLIVLFFITWSSFFHTNYIVAANTSPASLVKVMEKQLKTDEARNAIILSRLEALERIQQFPLPTHLLTKQLLKRIKTTLLMTNAEYSNLELTLKTAQLEFELTQSTIYALQRRSVDLRRLPIAAEIEATLREHHQLLEVQQKRIRVLQTTSDLLNRTILLIREWNKKLQIQIQSAIQHKRQHSFSTLLNRLEGTQKVWMDQLGALSHQLNSQESFAVFSQTTELPLVLNAIVAEEKNNLVHIQLSLETINYRLQQLSETLSHYPPLMILNTLQRPLEMALNQLQIIEELLQKKAHFFNSCLQLLADKKEDEHKIKSVVNTLKQLAIEYKQQARHVKTLIQQAQSELTLFTHQLHAYLSNRQDLPGLDVRAWLNLMQRLNEIPNLLSDRLVGLSDLIIAKIKQAPWWRSLLVAFLGIGWIRVLLIIKRLLKRRRLALLAESDQIMPSTLSGFFIDLFDKSLYKISVCLSAWSVLLIWEVPFQAFAWILNLFSVAIIFSIAIKSCRFWLVETTTQEKRFRNATLFYRLQSVLRIGGIITFFSLLAHQLVLDYEVRNFVARLFMLFLLVIALLLLRIWTLVPKLLEGYWAKRPRYLKQVVRWVSFLLPMSLLLNAILGLVGYVQLAWAIVGYQSLLLMALAIYPLITGFLNEVFNWLSEQSIRRFRNGWLWSEALLKPLYQILKFCILISIIVCLFGFAGWREQLFNFSTNPTIWLNKQLLVIADIPIDALKIFKLIIMSIFVIWLSQWAREFAYRWIFANLKDLGLRNSLSIFTQYMAVFLGVLSVLQVAGLTLSVLKYVLSGFAIGLSFGLRDLFNNFVTGILLLVERPLKVGDWVTIGQHDGQVIHIGARSIIITTEDHQELMVPNADLFYKHFINWTRHDSVVRITVPLSINRKDDPIKVREIILDVINSISKILHNPAPEVYFKATDQILLAFKVEYYVDLTQITSRSEVNSQFLFALWQRFSEEKISSPEIVHELNLKGDLGFNTLPNSSIEDQHA